MTSPYPPPKVHITTNSPDQAQTSSFLSPTLHPHSTQDIGPSSRLTYIYSTPPSPFATNTDIDIEYSVQVSTSRSFFPEEGATGCVIMDFAPGTEGEESFMHRTNTVDYIVVMEGSMELELSGGLKRVIGRGEVVVQRGSWHSWKNASMTEGARILAVAVGVQGAKRRDMDVLGVERQK